MTAAASSVPVVVALAMGAAAVAHASWNALAKSAPDQWAVFAVLGVSEFGCAVVLLALGQLPSAAAWPYLLISTALHVPYVLGLLLAYQDGDLGQVYPVARGTAPVLVAVVAPLLTGEVLSPAAAAGVAVVALGLVSLAGRPTGRAARRALLLAVAVGVAIAAYSLSDGLGVRHSHSALGYAAALFALQGLAVPVAVLLSGRRRAVLAALPRCWWRGALAGVLSVTAYSLVLWAQARTGLALVAALRETSVVVAALIGAVLLREGFGRRRVLASLLVAAGAILIDVR